MRSLVSTTSLARSSARHPWRTIGIWLLVLGTAMALMVTLLSDALSTEVTTLTNNPESAQAQALLHDRLGDTSESEFVIVQSGAGVTVDDPQFRAMVETLQADLTALGPDVVTGVTSYYQSGDESLVSADRTTTLLPVAIPDVAGYDVLPDPRAGQGHNRDERVPGAGHRSGHARCRNQGGRREGPGQGRKHRASAGPDHSRDRLRRTGRRVPANRSRHLRGTPGAGRRLPCSVSSWICPSQS